MFGLGKKKQKKKFEGLFQAGVEAVQAGDIQTGINTLQEAVDAAGDDFGKAGLAVFTLGEILLQVGQPEMGQTLVAQGYTMLGDAHRPPFDDRVRGYLGLTPDTPAAEVLAAAWEVDSLAKLRQGDLQGCLDAMRGATSTLSAAYGRDNAKMVVPMWRTMARLAGTSVAELASVVDEIGSRAWRIANASACNDEDRFWVLNYRAVALAAKRDKVGLQRTLPLLKHTAKMVGKKDVVDRVDKMSRELSRGGAVEMAFSVAPEEVAEIKFRQGAAG